MQRRHPPKNIFIKKQSGQVLIEYIALLCVSVLIILGVIYQYNDAFRAYTNAYFGKEGYLYCLIQNGLLPGESDICSPPSFNINNGKGLTGSINGEGGGTGSGAAKGGAGGKVGSGVGVGGTSLSGDRFAGGGGLIPFGGGAGGSGAKGAGGADGKGAGKNGAAGAAAGGTGDLDFSNVGRQQGAANGSGKLSKIRLRRGSLGDDGDSGTGKVQGNQNVPATERDLNPARFVSAEQKKRLQTHYQDVDASFSFGKILKYIFILIIGFSILFFVGSQIVAISRGKRKRN
jgi:hypothetical protein